VIALGRGGVLESVPLLDPCGGCFYESPGEDGLRGALVHFEEIEPRIQPVGLQRHAVRFSEQEFARKISIYCGLDGVSRVPAG
jgi:hypothetical protein